MHEKFRKQTGAQGDLGGRQEPTPPMEKESQKRYKVNAYHKESTKNLANYK